MPSFNNNALKNNSLSSQIRRHGLADWKKKYSIYPLSDVIKYTTTSRIYATIE